MALGIDYSFVGAIVGAIVLVCFGLWAAHPRSTGQRLAILGFGLGLFAIPPYLGDYLQKKIDQEDAVRHELQTRLQLEADFTASRANFRVVMDRAVTQIIQAFVKPAAPRDRQRAVNTSLENYRIIAGPLNPKRPVDVPNVNLPIEPQRSTITPVVARQETGQFPSQPSPSTTSTVPVVVPSVMPPPIVIPPTSTIVAPPPAVGGLP